MCRHLVYLGPPVSLDALLSQPPHGLVHQSYAPREMRGGGTINADGFGIGWYPRPGDPVRYRRSTPIWTDAGLTGWAPLTTAGAVLAAVRSATVGMPVIETAAAPFAGDGWLFSHNGVVPGWPDSVAKLAERLPVRDLLTLDAPTDAALLWALVRDALRGGADPAVALAGVLAGVRAAAPGARLNLLLTDGVTAVASTLGHSLWVRQRADSVLLSSEPLDDDPAWRALPDRQLVRATAAEVRLQALPDDVEAS
jgi:glutamine amidotransferase